MLAGMGKKIDERLMQVRATGLGEEIPSEGGFLLQGDLSYILLKPLFEDNTILQRCLMISVGARSNSVDLPTFDEVSRANGSRLGGITSYWMVEGQTKLPSKPKFGALIMKLGKLIGLCYGSDELVEDTALLGSLLVTGFNSEFSFRLIDGMVNGPGAGQMLGILASPSLVTVTKETGQMPATLQYENVVKMFARLLPSCKAGCWLYNKDIVPQLFTMGITLGMGGAPVFVPSGGASGSPFNTLLGLPMFPIEQASSLGTKGDLILADLSFYAVASKGGTLPMQYAQSMHAEFIKDEQAFRFVLRVAGQPILKSTIAPFKGSLAQSAFVALETR
jgi:HK97 family phage major capsid protein